MKQILFSLFVAFSVNVNAQDTSFTRICQPVVGELGLNFPVADAAHEWDEGLISIGTLDDQFATNILRVKELIQSAILANKAYVCNEVLENDIQFRALGSDALVTDLVDAEDAKIGLLKV